VREQYDDVDDRLTRLVEIDPERVWKRIDVGDAPLLLVGGAWLSGVGSAQAFGCLGVECIEGQVTAESLPEVVGGHP
jgi:hypothetical protein